MKLRNLILLLVIACLVISCNNNRYNIRLRGDLEEITIKRFENDIFGISPGEILPGIESLKSKYREFLTLFGYVINIGDESDPSWGENLVMFATDKQNRDVYLEVVKVFPDLDEIEKSLGKAWSLYKYYFPGEKVPGIYSFVSGFNNSIVVGDSTLAIGLDRYLGTDCRYYPMLGIYNYEIRRMVPEKIPTDCMYAWAASTWTDDGGSGSNNLLAEMLYEGKLLYFTRCMLPGQPDTLLFGFTGDQMKFCNNNEAQMWEYLQEYDLLFNTDPFTIRKFTGEAPFTSYFSNESPGRAAVWLSFRIIEQYMEKNRDVTLRQLMEDKDYQQILERARYFPR
jgi:hypothetical protein